ncbi:hypothetical protein IWZ01DRAFT_351195 [Phyllosticta capitalensis]
MHSFKCFGRRTPSAREEAADIYSDASDEEIEPLIGSRPTTADGSRPSTADSSTLSDALGMRGDNRGEMPSALANQTEEHTEGNEDRERVGGLEWAPNAHHPPPAPAGPPFPEAESTPNTAGLMALNWPFGQRQKQNAAGSGAGAVAGTSTSTTAPANGAAAAAQQTQPDSTTQQQAGRSSSAAKGQQPPPQAPATASSNTTGKRVTWLDALAQEPGYGTMGLGSDGDVDAGADAQASTAAAPANDDNNSAQAQTPAPQSSTTTPPQQEEGDAAATDATAPWDAAEYASWDPYVKHWFWWEVSDDYRQLAEEGRVGPTVTPAVSSVVEEMQAEPPAT